MKIATKSKRRWRERSFRRWTKKILNLVHYEQSYKRSCWPTLNRQCAFGVCQCIWLRAMWLVVPGKFYPSPLIFPRSDLGRRADSCWVLPQISSFHFLYLFLFLLLPFSFFFSFLFHVPSLRSKTLQIQLGCLGAALLAPRAGSGTEP